MRRMGGFGPCGGCNQLNRRHTRPRGSMAALAELVTLLVLTVIVASASPLRTRAADPNGVPTPASAGADDRVCFSQPLNAKDGLPSLINSTSSRVTPKIREELRRPVKIAWLDGLDLLTYEDAVLLSRVPGSVSVVLHDGLTRPFAECFGRHRGYLSIDCGSDLSDEAAQALGRHRGDLTLLGVSRMSDKALSDLANCDGRLALGLESLSAHEARILCRVRGGLCLPNVEIIDEETARVLATYAGALEIGLTEMTPEVARHLASRQSALGFYCRRQSQRQRLTPAAARELALYKGKLSLRPMNDARIEESVGALSAHAGELLLLLTEPVSESLALAASAHAGPLILSARGQLTPQSAAMLARHTSVLEVAGCDHYSPDVIHALSQHRGTELRVRLSGRLDESVARAMAAYPGRLIICESHTDPIRASTESVAAIASHCGRLTIPASLVRDDTIDALVGHVGGLHIRDWRDEVPSFEMARKLSATTGWLRIDAAMPADRLGAIASHVGDLVLATLPQREDEVNALLLRKDKLYFPDSSHVKSIPAARLMASSIVASDTTDTSYILGQDAVAIATELAKKRGPLSLPYLQYITEDALRALVQKADVELAPLDQLYVFDDAWCIVPAEDVVPESFREFNRTHQPPRSLEADRRWFGY